MIQRVLLSALPGSAESHIVIEKLQAMSTVRVAHSD